MARQSTPERKARAKKAGQLRPLSLPRRMAPTDAMFWYAESAMPIFRPIIGGLYILDRHPKPKGIEECVDVALRLVPRLTQRVVEAPFHLGLPEWADDRHFDRAYHLRHVSVPEPGDMRGLLDLTAALLATPIDRERPLWEAYWIDGLEGGRSAFFLKLHHAVVDGVGAIALLRGLTQETRDGGVASVSRGSRRKDDAAGLTQRVGSLVVDNALESTRLAWRVAGASLRFFRNPGSSIDELARTARGLRGVLSDAGNPLIEDPLAKTASGLSRRLDVMEVSLERLRKIKAGLGVTLNDLVLAVLTGTLGAYHRERRAHVDALNCMVPMNLRTKDEESALGNRVGNITIVLPVAERRPERRLRKIVEQTRAAKSDKRGAMYPFLVQTLTVLPGFAFRWLARQSLGRINVACTNVPGVRECRYMAGAEVQAIFPFASVVEKTPLVLALLSYSEKMDIGIDTDPEAIPDPHRIAELFEKGLDEMEAMSSQMAVQI